MAKHETYSHSDTDIVWCQHEDCGSSATYLVQAVYTAGILAGVAACDWHIQDALDAVNESADELESIESVLLVDLKIGKAWNRAR